MTCLLLCISGSSVLSLHIETARMLLLAHNIKLATNNVIIFENLGEIEEH